MRVEIRICFIFPIKGFYVHVLVICGCGGATQRAMLACCANVFTGLAALTFVLFSYMEFTIASTLVQWSVPYGGYANLARRELEVCADAPELCGVVSTVVDGALYHTWRGAQSVYAARGGHPSVYGTSGYESCSATASYLSGLRCARLWERYRLRGAVEPVCHTGYARDQFEYEETCRGVRALYIMVIISLLFAVMSALAAGVADGAFARSMTCVGAGLLGVAAVCAFFYTALFTAVLAETQSEAEAANRGQRGTGTATSTLAVVCVLLPLAAALNCASAASRS